MSYVVFLIALAVLLNQCSLPHAVSMIDDPDEHTFFPNECTYNCAIYGGLCALHLVRGCARYFTNLCDFQKVACTWRVPYQVVPGEVCAMAEEFCDDCQVFKLFNETVKASTKKERIKEILAEYYKSDNKTP